LGDSVGHWRPCHHSGQTTVTNGPSTFTSQCPLDASFDPVVPSLTQQKETRPQFKRRPFWTRHDRNMKQDINFHMLFCLKFLLFEILFVSPGLVKLEMTESAPRNQWGQPQRHSPRTFNPFNVVTRCICCN
jgi:hypothetical protein